MNGPHDVGGEDGHVQPRDAFRDVAFRADWERRVQALFLGMLTDGAVNGDEFRHVVERLDRRRYLNSTYYERWVLGLTQLLLEKRVVTPDDLMASTTDALAVSAPADSTFAGRVMTTVLEDGTLLRLVADAPWFEIGDEVIVRNIHPSHHTRCPRYLRGRAGVVTRHHGAHVFPDSHARGLGEDPRYLYTVEFASRELWGSDVSEHDRLSAALWEPYLAPAAEHLTTTRTDG